MLYFNEYILLFKYLITCLIIVLLLFFLSLLAVYQNIDYEKFSVYECGFIPFIHTRIKFGVHFYLVGVVFVVFDVELSFLIP
jgi:NADH:ubiquinone oxidoreductase subunit 3 (subunit A)